MFECRSHCFENHLDLTKTANCHAQRNRIESRFKSSPAATGRVYTMRTLPLTLGGMLIQGALAQQSPDFDYVESFGLLKNVSTTKDSFSNVQDGVFRFFMTTDCLQIIKEPSPFGIDGTCWVCFLVRCCSAVTRSNSLLLQHAAFSLNPVAIVSQAQNPDAPYGLLMLNISGEESDAYSGYPLTDKAGRSATWHLNPGDVIVITGRTPPACQYFSFTNYLYSRYSAPDFVPDASLNPITGRACLPGTLNERCEYFASVSDTVNLDRGLNLPQGKGKFNATFALVLSGSERATALAVEALQEAMVPLDRISNFTFPGSELSLGSDTQADTFTTIMRTAFYENEVDKNAFFADIPFKVLRMELNPDVSNTLHTKSAYIPRATGVQTDGTLAGLSIESMKSATFSLSKHVLSSLTGSSHKHWDIAVTEMDSGEPDHGNDCIDLGQRCLADCRDTLYPFTIRTYTRNAVCEYMHKWFDANLLCKSTQTGYLTEDLDDTIIVVGVNHFKANMSAYSSLAVYDMEYLWGVTGVGNEVLDGSADEYVSGDIDPTLAQALPYLYAYKFKRRCNPGEKFCLTIPAKATADNYELFIPLAHAIGFAERMYDNPFSHVGPSVDEVVMPVQIHVKRRVTTPEEKRN